MCMLRHMHSVHMHIQRSRARYGRCMHGYKQPPDLRNLLPSPSTACCHTRAAAGLAGRWLAATAAEQHRWPARAGRHAGIGLMHKWVNLSPTADIASQTKQAAKESPLNDCCWSCLALRPTAYANKLCFVTQLPGGPSGIQSSCTATFAHSLCSHLFAHKQCVAQHCQQFRHQLHRQQPAAIVCILGCHIAHCQQLQQRRRRQR